MAAAKGDAAAKAGEGATVGKPPGNTEMEFSDGVEISLLLKNFTNCSVK